MFVCLLLYRHTYRTGEDFVGLGDVRAGWAGRWAGLGGAGGGGEALAVQGLNAPPVILTQLQGECEAVERRHNRPWDLGVLEAKDMAKLVSRNLEQVRT